MSKPMNFFKLLSGELAPDKLILKFLMLLMELQNVERGSIWTPQGSDYVCREAAGGQSEDIKGMRIPRDRRSIVGWVMENGRMTVAEAGRDNRHFKEAENGMTIKSRLILAFPLLGREGRVLGAVEIIDTSAGGKRMNLDQGYLELLQNLVDVGSIALSNSMEFTQQRQANRQLRRAIESIRTRTIVGGTSKSFARTLSLAKNYAATDYPVLITGESGTGKELLARHTHQESPRAAKPFLAQNCSAIPSSLLASELFGYRKGAFTGAYTNKAGLFEAANGGTVFLDEIGEMPLELQASLLRVLQDNEIKPLGGAAPRTVDVRVVVATNKDLEKAISDGLFREDLYFRINVLPLPVPPLRKRREDIPYLLTHFLAREASVLECAPKTLDDKALETLCAYAWPGNVRELENVVKQVLVGAAGRIIRVADLPAGVRAAPSGDGNGPGRAAPPERTLFDGATWEEVERAYILRLLKNHKWVVTRAAEAAGLKRSTFDSRMRRLGISKSTMA